MHRMNFGSQMHTVKVHMSQPSALTLTTTVEQTVYLLVLEAESFVRRR